MKIKKTDDILVGIKFLSTNYLFLFLENDLKILLSSLGSERYFEC